jgi:hypothetical protein
VLIACSALADEGLALAQKVYDRPNGRDLTTLGRMVLTAINRGAKPPI